MNLNHFLNQFRKFVVYTKSIKMNSEYQKIIDSWTENQKLEVAVITIFEKVRDIPYGDIGSRDPLQVYKQNKGTCSGKHALLKGLYTTLEIPVKESLIMHCFNKLPVIFPQNIQQIIKGSTIFDPHNFIQIQRNNKWLTLDVTWDIGLKKLGFPVNENWSGFESLPISVAKGGEIYETQNVMELKRQLISEIPKNDQITRKLFLKKLTIWLEASRKLL